MSDHRCCYFCRNINRVQNALTMRMNGDQKERARKMVAVLQVQSRPLFLARYARRSRGLRPRERARVAFPLRRCRAAAGVANNSLELKPA